MDYDTTNAYDVDLAYDVVTIPVPVSFGGIAGVRAYLDGKVGTKEKFSGETGLVPYNGSSTGK